MKKTLIALTFALAAPFALAHHEPELRDTWYESDGVVSQEEYEICSVIADTAYAVHLAYQKGWTQEAIREFYLDAGSRGFWLHVVDLAIAHSWEVDTYPVYLKEAAAQAFAEGTLDNCLALAAGREV